MGEESFIERHPEHEILMSPRPRKAFFPSPLVFVHEDVCNNSLASLSGYSMPSPKKIRFRLVDPKQETRLQPVRAQEEVVPQQLVQLTERIEFQLVQLPKRQRPRWFSF
jgi:hypothetical protein